MATRAQKEAARRNIKKAQAARWGNPKKRRKKKTSSRRRKKTTSRKRKSSRRRRNAAPKSAPRRAAPRRAPARAANAAPRRRRRRRKTTARKRRRNSWYDNAPGHSRASKKGWRRGKKRTRCKPKRAGCRKLPTQKQRSAARRNIKKARRSRNPAPRAPRQDLALIENPQSGFLGGLIGNPDSPFTTENLKGFAIAATGVGLGLVVADLVDRYVATRTPKDGERPLYGKDAAAAQRRRPDAMRLGIQAGGALASMALAYWTRNIRILPWFLGGTAVAFGANLVMKLTDWWIMPTLLKAEKEGAGYKEGSEFSLGARLFPLEQKDVQDALDEMFKDMKAMLPVLQGENDEDAAKAVKNPLGPGVPTSGPAYELGKGNNTERKPRFIHTGRLGKCAACGGEGGCYDNCPNYSDGASSNDCLPGGGRPGAPSLYGTPGQKCVYEVQQGDNFTEMLGESGTDRNAVIGLNKNQEPKDFWAVGSKVVLPYHMCKFVRARIEKKNGNGGVAGKPDAPPPPPGPPAPPVIPPPVQEENNNARSLFQDA